MYAIFVSTALWLLNCGLDLFSLAKLCKFCYIFVVFGLLLYLLWSCMLIIFILGKILLIKFFIFQHNDHLFLRFLFCFLRCHGLFLLYGIIGMTSKYDFLFSMLFEIACSWWYHLGISFCCQNVATNFQLSSASYIFGMEIFYLPL